MFRIGSTAWIKLVLRPLGYLLRDLAPWLVRAIAGWMLARLGGRDSRRKTIPCRSCPFVPVDELPAPAAPADVTGPTAQEASGVPATSSTSAATPLLVTALCVWLAAIGGGCSPPAPYVRAERATFDAIAPEYAGYIDADPTLDDSRRARRHRTLHAWRLRLEAAETSRVRDADTGTEVPAAITSHAFQELSCTTSP